MGGTSQDLEGYSEDLGLVDAFNVVLASGRKPEKILTDRGTEFFNKHFQKKRVFICIILLMRPKHRLSND